MFKTSILVTAVLVTGLVAGCVRPTTERPQSAARSVPEPGSSLGIASVPNLRDVGGYPTAAGATVRRGLVYRSNQLNPITPEDMKKIARLGLKHDFDLRTVAEADARPDEIPTGVAYHLLNVLADATAYDTAKLMALMHEPDKANKELGGGKVEAIFEQMYRDFIRLPSANSAFSKLFSTMARPGESPVLFHCTAGKDRTGWAAAALLTLLGVPRDVVTADYLRSNDYLLPAYQKEIDGFVEGGGERSIAVGMVGVRMEYLNAAFDEMEKRYGTIENYFAEALGIDASGQNALRNLYLEKENRL